MSRNLEADQLEKWVSGSDETLANFRWRVQEALATERRLTVEKVRQRAVLASDDYSDKDHKYAEIPLAYFMEILDNLATAAVDEEEA